MKTLHVLAMSALILLPSVSYAGSVSPCDRYGGAQPHWCKMRVDEANSSDTDRGQRTERSGVVDSSDPAPSRSEPPGNSPSNPPSDPDDSRGDPGEYDW